jgi:carbamoyltransferase
MVDHHLAHGVGSYLVSGFADAAILSIDGWGEWATTWMGHADGLSVFPSGTTYFPHSLGCFYSAATEFCGFKPNYDEGKTMGLAPTGDATRYYDVVKKMVAVGPDGQLRLRLDLFQFPKVNGVFCAKGFSKVFGPPRARGEEIKQNHRDVAAAFQRVLEENFLKMSRILLGRGRSRNLVLAGGVALNSVANGRIRRETDFRSVYVMPGASDNGTCIGAAYYVFNKILGRHERWNHDHPYVGTSYENSEIKRTLSEAKVPYRAVSEVCVATAELLRRGRIVGWFQGRMEFGPRALGGRSILADPTVPSMKDRINAEVKHREAFRPFAPSVPAEDVTKYFDFRGESPFMLMVCDVKKEMRGLLPAITHVDGTARLQTVSCEANPRYYRLLREFERLSGVPILLNTSFNVMDQPIVESPRDALRCFFSTGLDALVIGDFVIEKEFMGERIEVRKHSLSIRAPVRVQGPCDSTVADGSVHIVQESEEGVRQ